MLKSNLLHNLLKLLILCANWFITSDPLVILKKIELFHNGGYLVKLAIILVAITKTFKFNIFYLAMQRISTTKINACHLVFLLAFLYKPHVLSTWFGKIDLDIQRLPFICSCYTISWQAGPVLNGSLCQRRRSILRQLLLIKLQIKKNMVDHFINQIRPKCLMMVPTCTFHNPDSAYYLFHYIYCH